MAALVCAAFMADAQALPVNTTTIVDAYEGAATHGYGDRIGNLDYEVERLDVVRYGSGSDQRLNVKVYTYFNQARDSYGTQFGDLFLSVDGWRPYGSAPYALDDHSNGEDWEFVFDTSANQLYGGAFEILLAEQVAPSITHPGSTVRNGQEVLRGVGGVAVGTTNWVSLANASTAVGVLGYVEYDLLLADLGLSGSYDLGLKWGMTCANDSIEGLVHNVSEPPLWALSLVPALLLWGRRRRRS